MAVAALATLSFVSFAGASPASPFTGTWWSLDPADDGVDKATFGVGGSIQVIDSVTIATNACKVVPAVMRVDPDRKSRTVLWTLRHGT